MPYIPLEDRPSLEPTTEPTKVGELTYVLTRQCDMYLHRNGAMRYQDIAEVLGALESTKLELYRRQAVPYEERKRADTGDCYRFGVITNTDPDPIAA